MQEALSRKLAWSFPSQQLAVGPSEASLCPSEAFLLPCLLLSLCHNASDWGCLLCSGKFDFVPTWSVAYSHPLRRHVGHPSWGESEGEGRMVIRAVNQETHQPLKGAWNKRHNITKELLFISLCIVWLFSEISSIWPFSRLPLLGFMFPDHSLIQRRRSRYHRKEVALSASLPALCPPAKVQRGPVKVTTKAKACLGNPQS
jgi:hypothetical protein